MNRFWLFSAENVFDFGLLPKIYSAYSCLWSKSIPTCRRWCQESKTPPCENGRNLQSLVSFHVIYETDLLPTGNIWSYDSSYKLAANSRCIWYFVLTFKYSYCLTGFSKIYWCASEGINLQGWSHSFELLCWMDGWTGWTGLVGISNIETSSRSPLFNINFLN